MLGEFGRDDELDDSFASANLEREGPEDDKDGDEFIDKNVDQFSMQLLQCGFWIMYRSSIAISSEFSCNGWVCFFLFQQKALQIARF